MYHIHLTNRYLSTRVIPLIAVAAVALCVALVIIVVSVMTGFLDMVKSSGRALMGDVVLSYTVNGIPYYDDLIQRIEALPEAEGATPVVDGYGLLKMPYPAGQSKDTRYVQFWGVDPESFSRVTQYADTLWWKLPTDEEMAEMGEDDFRRYLIDNIGEDGMELLYEQGLSLRRAAADGTSVAGMTMGMHVSAANQRQSDGSYRPVAGPFGYWFMPVETLVLSTLPADTAVVSPEPESAALQVVNEFNSGVFVIDEVRIIIPIDVAQRISHLDEAAIVDDEGEDTGFVDPARATMILVRAASGITPEVLRDKVSEVYEEFYEALMLDETVSPLVVPPREHRGLQIETWLQQQKEFIGPVEKERELMRILFSIIYLVCAGLVLAIFWAIVFEKTRDIGILRSVGASRMGIGFIFLRYGAIIGVIGAVAGLGIAYLVVHNINSIHDAMGREVSRWIWSVAVLAACVAVIVTAWRGRGRALMPIVLGAMLTVVVTGVALGLMLHRGTVVWDPAVYYFNVIPNEMDPVAAITTMVGAVVFSVIGAFVPAARAADTDPVRALHYE